MAARKAAKKRKKRRTPDEIIADLQQEIRRVRSQQQARERKPSPATKSALAALKAIDKALASAAEHDETDLRHALAEGRRALAAHLVDQGLEVPRVDLPRARRPRR